jgi:DNA-damage-inducible protein D
MSEINSNEVSNFEPDSFNIRKIWHNDEWYYSVVDIIAEASERTQAEAVEYWRKLRNRLAKEGNETVTKLDALKLTARDGKLRRTEVVNTAQALRLLQEIPGTRTDGVKNWLASVGAERLQEQKAQDEVDEPELEILLRNVTKDARLAGRPDSWIVARVEGIVTRHEFVAALKAAVIDAIPTMYLQATEKLYQGLWERTTAQLRGELHLKKKENLRDHFGEYALIYTRLAEKLTSDKLGQAEIVTFSIAMEIVWMVAKHISVQAKATSQMLGYDLVTEQPLLPAP